MLFVCLKLSILTIVITTASAATITEGPVSVSALVGENAQFHCAGTGASIVWIVDGIYYATDINITKRGIYQDIPVTSLGMIQSNLTVPATIENNGTTVLCKILLPGEVTSNNATLTVLGIDTIQVINVRFNPAFSTLLWSPPPTAGVLSGLSYIVIIVNNKTNDVIVSATTNSTQYLLPVNDLQHCQYYTANVTAFSSKQHGDSVVIVERTPGDYYDLASVSQPVVASYNITHSAATFAIDIQSRSLNTVCPNQELTSVTYPTTNHSNKTPQIDVTSAQSGVTNYTVYVEKDYHYACDIKIGVGDSEIEMMTVHFSSYDVQSCDVHTDLATILVECTFAINSVVEGVVVIQDEQGHTAAIRPLHRLNDNKGSVNITGLPAGDYRVRVFDDYLKNTSGPAYKHNTLLTIIAATDPSPVNTLSAFATLNSAIPSASSIMLSNSIDVTPSVVSKSAFNIPAAAFSIIASVSCVVVFTIVIVIVVFYINRKYSYGCCCCKTSTTSNIKQESRYVAREEIVQLTQTEPTYMEPNTNSLIALSTTASCNSLYTTNPPLKQELHYAQIQHSANPPAPALPAERSPVQYAVVKKPGTVKSQEPELQYAEVVHSGNSPAAPLPAELNPVKYATMKQTEIHPPTVHVSLSQEN